MFNVVTIFYVSTYIRSEFLWSQNHVTFSKKLTVENKCVVDMSEVCVKHANKLFLYFCLPENESKFGLISKPREANDKDNPVAGFWINSEWHHFLLNHCKTEMISMTRFNYLLSWLDFKQLRFNFSLNIIQMEDPWFSKECQYMLLINILPTIVIEHSSYNRHLLSLECVLYWKHII